MEKKIKGVVSALLFLVSVCVYVCCVCTWWPFVFKVMYFVNRKQMRFLFAQSECVTKRSILFETILNHTALLPTLLFT